MFFLSKPAESVVKHFLAAQESSQCSYAHVGESRAGTSPAGYVTDHNRIQLGSGIDVFDRAKTAIRQWKMFAMPWVKLYWPDAPIIVGSDVAILISHFGFWSLNAARIVYLVDDHGTSEKFGFAYGTLPEHGERGEERFTVEFHAEDGSVWYDLFAFSRPNLAARLAYPMVRALQRRFADDSKLAMKRAVDTARV
jgi:uncharacterized protein (UPF0548 family)